MKKILKLFDESKTLQIILDKCIIGIFILLAAFLININLENAKTKNKIAELSVSRFINATNDIWKKIDEVEMLSSEICSDAFVYTLKKKSFDKYSFQYQSSFSEQYKLYELKMNESKLFISQNEYILGHDVSHQFYIYLEYLRMQTDTKIDYYLSGTNNDKERNLKAEEEFSKEKNKYKFNLLDAQEFAIKRFLK